jgi:hypothetical protein
VYVKSCLTLSGVRFSIEFDVAMGKVVPDQKTYEKLMENIK